MEPETPKIKYEDVTRVCRDCSSDFLFSASEQGFYVKKGFVPPKRCPPCRKRASAANQAPPVTPDYYDRKN